LSTTNPTPTVTLDATQAIYVRQLLYTELHTVANEISRMALEAAEGHDIAGDDAHGTYRQRITVIAELLDTIGWSTTGDQAVVVDLERRKAGAA
jgi:hypothetical protein